MHCSRPTPLATASLTLLAECVGQDDRRSDVYITGISQSGLGMPDRDMYLLNEPISSRCARPIVDHLTRC